MALPNPLPRLPPVLHHIPPVTFDPCSSFMQCSSASIETSNKLHGIATFSSSLASPPTSHPSRHIRPFFKFYAMVLHIHDASQCHEHTDRLPTLALHVTGHTSGHPWRRAATCHPSPQHNTPITFDPFSRYFSHISGLLMLHMHCTAPNTHLCLLIPWPHYTHAGCL